MDLAVQQQRFYFWSINAAHTWVQYLFAEVHLLLVNTRSTYVYINVVKIHFSASLNVHNIARLMKNVTKGSLLCQVFFEVQISFALYLLSRLRDLFTLI